MNTAAAMTIATGLTVARRLSTPTVGPLARDISRILIGGTFATAGLLALAQFAPSIADGLSVVVMLTALLVHGVALGDAVLALIA